MISRSSALVVTAAAAFVAVAGLAAWWSRADLDHVTPVPPTAAPAKPGQPVRRAPTTIAFDRIRYDEATLSLSGSLTQVMLAKDGAEPPARRPCEFVGAETIYRAPSEVLQTERGTRLRRTPIEVRFQLPRSRLFPFDEFVVDLVVEPVSDWIESAPTVLTPIPPQDRLLTAELEGLSGWDVEWEGLPGSNTAVVRLHRRALGPLLRGLAPLPFVLLFALWALRTLLRLEPTRLVEVPLGGVLITCAVLLLLTFLAHAEIRYRLWNAPIVYIEAFFVITYAVISLVALAACTPGNGAFVLSALYWSLVTGLIAAISLAVLPVWSAPAWVGNTCVALAVVGLACSALQFRRARRALRGDAAAPAVWPDVIHLWTLRGSRCGSASERWTDRVDDVTCRACHRFIAMDEVIPEHTEPPDAETQSPSVLPLETFIS